MSETNWYFNGQTRAAPRCCGHHCAHSATPRTARAPRDAGRRTGAQSGISSTIAPRPRRRVTRGCIRRSRHVIHYGAINEEEAGTHITQYTLDITQYTLHITQYILDITQYTLDITHYTIHRGPVQGPVKRFQHVIHYGEIINEETVPLRSGVLNKTYLRKIKLISNYHFIMQYD